MEEFEGWTLQRSDASEIRAARRIDVELGRSVPAGVG